MRGRGYNSAEQQMSLATRAIISLLAGVGAGLLGFWVVWKCLVAFVWKEVPGVSHDGWLLTGIFVPGVLVPLLVFRAISLPKRQKPASV